MSDSLYQSTIIILFVELVRCIAGSFMAALSIGLANSNWCIVHFRTPIHVQEESDEYHFPFDRFEDLARFWSEQVNFYSQHDPLLVVAGKPMGGRIASILADEWFAAGQISGCIYLVRYLFHPFGTAYVLRVYQFTSDAHTNFIDSKRERPNGSSRAC